jgi:hypothetical protein
MSLILSGTDGLSDVDGTAATPAIRGTDANTGIFFPAADTIAFAEGGAEVARFDSAGNFGLGVTPSAWDSTYKAIQVGARSMFFGIGSEANMANNAYYNSGYKYVATSAAGLYTIDANVHKWYNAASGTAGNAITFTQAMTLDASGNLGIGTTSPTVKLDVAGAISATDTISTSKNTNAAFISFQATNANAGASTEAQFKASNGTDVGVFGIMGTGASTYGARLAGDTFIYSGINTASKGITIMADTGTGVIKFAAGGNTERARIDSSGNLLVNTTSTGANAGVGVRLIGASGLIQGTQAGSTNSTTNLDLYSTGAGAYRFYVGMTGTVFATNTTISAISDIRFKENVRDLNVGLSEVMALKPRLYDWKEGKGADTKNARGFIAQEFEEVFPDLIDEWKDSAPEGEEPYKSVRQDLIPVLVKAIQEQQAIITTLTARITALESA